MWSNSVSQVRPRRIAAWWLCLHVGPQQSHHAGQPAASWSSSQRFTGSPQRNPPRRTVVAQHPVAGHEQRRRVAGARRRRRAYRGRPPGLRRVLGVADGRARRHRPQHLPRLFEERSGALADRDVVDGAEVAVVVAGDRGGDVAEIGRLPSLAGRSVGGTAAGGVDVGGPARGEHRPVGVDDCGEGAGRGLEGRVRAHAGSPDRGGGAPQVQGRVGTPRGPARRVTGEVVGYRGQPARAAAHGQVVGQ